MQCRINGMKVAFRKHDTRLFSRLVQWWTRSPYAHCELVMSSDYGRAMCWSSSFLDGGVRFKLIDLHPDKWDIIPVDGDEWAAERWFMAHNKQAYDVRGLLGFVWRPNRDSKTKWFCSEAIAAALGFADPWRFDPATLYAALVRK